jgi:ArsR family transcriptional regulator, arsenate/arsenite/antimonite-responsive transcriptional repressor
MDKATQHIAAFQALSDKNRLCIIKLLAEGELCGCQINEYFRISQPTLSHHMKILCSSGLVLPRKEATMIHYCINTEMMRILSECFTVLAGAREGRNEALPRDCCKDDTSAEEEIKDGIEPS